MIASLIFSSTVGQNNQECKLHYWASESWDGYFFCVFFLFWTIVWRGFGVSCLCAWVVFACDLSSRGLSANGCNSPWLPICMWMLSAWKSSLLHLNHVGGGDIGCIHSLCHRLEFSSKMIAQHQWLNYCCKFILLMLIVTACELWLRVTHHRMQNINA